MVFRFIYSYSAKLGFPLVWIVFASIGLLTTMQGWILHSTVSHIRLHEDDNEEGGDYSNRGYGAVSGGDAQDVTFKVVESSTREHWLKCIDIRVQGQSSTFIFC